MLSDVQSDIDSSWNDYTVVACIIYDQRKGIRRYDYTRCYTSMTLSESVNHSARCEA